MRSRTSRSATACTFSAAHTEGDAEIELVLAMLRARQMWGGEQSVPGLREALGLSEDGDESRNRVDDVEEKAHALVRGMYDADWNPAAAEQLSDDETVVKILQFAATEVVPRLRQTNNEIKQVLHAPRRRLHRRRPEWVTAARPDQRSSHWS